MGLRLVFVRHGLSSFNERGLIQGRTDDSYLTDEGYEALSKNFAQIRAYMLQQDEIIKSYKEYYESENGPSKKSK